MRILITLILVIVTILAISYFSLGTWGQKRFALIWEFNDNPPLNLGVPPYKSDDQIQKEFEPILVFLGHHLKRQVKLNVSVDYFSLANLLDLEIIDFAWISAGLLENEAKKHDWEVLFRPVQNGKIHHRGVIFSKKGQGINSLNDLKGKRFAYVDRNSGSGFLYPVRLFQKQGIDPLNFFSEISFTGNHSVSLKKIMDGSCDGAAVYEEALLEIQKSASDTGGVGIEPIAYTDWILNDAFVVRKNFDPVLKNKIRKLMVEMEKNEKGPETLSELMTLQNIERFISEEEIRKE